MSVSNAQHFDLLGEIDAEAVYRGPASAAIDEMKSGASRQSDWGLAALGIAVLAFEWSSG